MSMLNKYLKNLRFGFIEKVGCLAIMAGFFVSFAEAQTFQGIATNILNLLNNGVVPLLFAAATIVFFWGIVKYIGAAGDEDKIAEGRKFMMWGLIGLFVMVAVWGIVSLFVTFFGFNVQAPALPNLPGYNGSTNQTQSQFPSGGNNGTGGSNCGGYTSPSSCNAANGCQWDLNQDMCV